MALASYKNQEQLAQWLSEAIMNEMKKPIDEINVEFVDSCEALLNTLMGEPQLTDSEIKKRIDKIMKKKGANTHKLNFFRRSKGLIAASIVAVLFIGSSIAVCANNPSILNMIPKAIEAGIGNKVEESGVTYEYIGETIVYDTVADLVKSEKLDIKYPSEFPYNAKVLSVYRTDPVFLTVFHLDDPRVTFSIEHNTSSTYETLDYTEVVTKDGYDFYLCFKPDHVNAFLFIQNDVYNLQCETKEDLMIMINSFNFE